MFLRNRIEQGWKGEKGGKPGEKKKRKGIKAEGVGHALRRNIRKEKNRIHNKNPAHHKPPTPQPERQTPPHNEPNPNKVNLSREPGEL